MFHLCWYESLFIERRDAWICSHNEIFFIFFVLSTIFLSLNPCCTNNFICLSSENIMVKLLLLLKRNYWETTKLYFILLFEKIANFSALLQFYSFI